MCRAAIAVSGLPIDTSTTGTHVVTYTVSDSAGNVGQASRTVNVVDVVMPLTVTRISPSAINRADLPAGVSVTITGTGFVADPTVTFQNESGPTPSATGVALIDAQILTATVSGSSGGPRKPRFWDVVVTNPGGAIAVCAGCLVINP